MIVYLYRWRLRPDQIEQFNAGWTYMTKRLLKCGSLGSRLHLGSDGIHYAYAQWPNAAVREAANPLGHEVENARQMMREAVVEAFPYIILDPIEDYLDRPITEEHSQHVPALNQITVGCYDLDESISFYENLGLVLIVRNPHYARLECPNGLTLSLELLDSREKTGPTAIYLEHPRLDSWVLTLKRRGLVLEQEIQDKPCLWKEAWLRDPFGNRVRLFYAGINRRSPPWRLP